MARYYLLFDTVNQYKTISNCNSFKDMLQLISSSSEYSEIHLKRQDKRILNDIRNKLGRFNDKEKVKTDIDKRFELFQAVIGGIKLEDWSLSMEAEQVISIGERVLLGLEKYLLDINSLSAIYAVQLSRSVKQRMWENSQEVGRQLVLK